MGLHFSPTVLFLNGTFRKHKSDLTFDFLRMLQRGENKEENNSETLKPT